MHMLTCFLTCTSPSSHSSSACVRNQHKDYVRALGWLSSSPLVGNYDDGDDMVLLTSGWDGAVKCLGGFSNDSQ